MVRASGLVSSVCVAAVSLAVARAFLGYLVVGDYAGYKALFAGGVIEVGCMARAMGFSLKGWPALSSSA
jgi:hypothetical protein